MLQCEERIFEVADMQFAAKYWRNPNNDHDSSSQRRVIALHGWLDNCASFDFLAPHLEAEVLCIDLAGHGQSGFRKHFGAYNVWLDVPEMAAIADQMNWPTFDLVAHSRGACIGYLLASVYPSRVKHFFALDGLFPLIAEPSSAREQLIHSLATVKKQLNKKPSVYSSREAAIKARAGGMFKVTDEEAAALANRSLEKVIDGFSWRYDPKVNAPSELRFTAEQIVVLGQGIESNVELFMAEDGMLFKNDEFKALLSNFPSWQQHVLPGGHHFHMSEQGSALADSINEYWRSNGISHNGC